MSRVILLSIGFNDSDANSICTRQIINGLRENGDSVDLYCIKKSIKDIDTETEFGKVFYFYNEYTEINCFFEKSGKEINSLPLLIKYAVKALQRLKSIPYTKFGNIYGDTIKRTPLFSKIIEEDNKKHYDKIIAVVQPFAYAKLAGEIKKKLNNRPSCYLYMLDPYVFNYTMSEKNIENRKKQFEKYTENFDGMIITRGIYEEAKRKSFCINKDCIVVDLPNLVEKQRTEHSKNLPDKTEILFAGWFYKNIRNPRKMIPVLDRILENDDKTVVTMFCRGCAETIENFAERHGNNVNIKGIVPHSELEQYAEGADILLNLGNTIVNQLPSKVFEYIASGKPIINFYFDDKDTSLYYLKKYPLAYNFNLNNYSETDIEGLRKFIREKAGLRISYNEATENFSEAKAENVVKKIVKFISEGEKNV